MGANMAAVAAETVEIQDPFAGVDFALVNKFRAAAQNFNIWSAPNLRRAYADTYQAVDAALADVAKQCGDDIYTNRYFIAAICRSPVCEYSH